MSLYCVAIFERNIKWRVQQKIPPWDFGWATLYHTEIIIPGPFPYCAYSGMAIRNFRVASKKEKECWITKSYSSIHCLHFKWWQRHFAYCNADVKEFARQQHEKDCKLATVALFNHPSAPLRRCFISLLSYSAMRLRECIECFMRRTAILKNNSTAEKRRQEGAFALASIAHYCFVEIKSNCGFCGFEKCQN